MSFATTYQLLNEAAEATGLALRGGFELGEREQVGALSGMRCIVLLGIVGARQWPHFAACPEAADGVAHPLDRWSRRVTVSLGHRFGATPLFPFEGPPYWPFQEWAKRAEPVAPSPLGLMIHPRYGLWHSYRAALAFNELIDVPLREEAPSPCDACADRPCLNACPSGAHSLTGFEVHSCAALLRLPKGTACMSGGCLARRGCPVGSDYAQTPEQAQFHMQAFAAARG